MRASAARGLRRSLALLAASLLLAGCAPLGLRRPLVLYVAISTMGDERLDRGAAQMFHNRFRKLIQGFQRLHPEVRVQLAVYQEQELLSQMRRRERSGLGPDLIVTTSEQANALFSQGLSVAIPLGPQLRQSIDPALLRRVTDRQGRLSSVPQVLYTQLACYDTRRLPSAPATVQDLLAASARGARVGLALRPRELLWSAGSLGAMPALRSADAGRQPDPRQMQGLRDWIRWLQDAESQSRLTFVEEESTLRDSLRSGQLDWISCSSSDLQVLQQALGPHLGVAPLPDGRQGASAAPVNRLRVVALGRGSSPAQRQLALALAGFSLSPMVQRNLTLENLSFLPVNPHVGVPVKDSRVLAAMEVARQQAIGSEALLAHLHATDPRLQHLRDVILPVVFGQLTPAQAAQRIVTILRSRP